MKHNATLYMDDFESEICVRDSLEIKSIKNIEVITGKIIIGKNLIRTEENGYFITREAVEVILKGDIEEGEFVRIQGPAITLEKVYVEGKVEKYKFKEGLSLF